MNLGYRRYKIKFDVVILSILYFVTIKSKFLLLKPVFEKIEFKMIKKNTMLFL